MRIMYNSYAPYLIPEDAEIVALYPSHFGPDWTGHSNALIVRVDDVGNQVETCHILDLVSESSRHVNGRSWVENWYKLHPEGMEAVGGYILRPVVLVMAQAARAIHVACAPYDIDVWARDISDDPIPIAGCFAKWFRDGADGEQPYGESMVYRDDWGQRPIASTQTPKRVTRWPGVPGAVWYKDEAGDSVSVDVVSFDRGATWKRS